MTPSRPTLTRATLRSIVAVLDAPTDGFVALVHVAGLDRARDFRGAILDGVDFGTDDLTGFDFSGADLTGTDLTRATGLDKIITDVNTRLPNHVRHSPPDWDRLEVRRIILAGETPPRAWWPFITKLDLGTVAWPPVRDLSPLSELTALQSLNLRHTEATDLSPLSRLTGLQSLDLRGTQVSDLSPLSALTALRSLDLRGTQADDVAPLAALTALQSLNLSNTRVSDVAPLSSLTALQSLDLSGTRVSDVSPLSKLTALRTLNLWETSVTDVSPLSGLIAVQIGGLSKMRQVVGGKRRPSGV